MPGVPLVVGVVACTAALAVGFAQVAGAAAFSQRLAGAADAAALAAADTASGVATGVPCERAAEVAAASGVALATCDLAGLVATVSVSGSFGPIAATATARAGPPA